MQSVAQVPEVPLEGDQLLKATHRLPRLVNTGGTVTVAHCNVAGGRCRVEMPLLGK